ncbi:efflux RND transporter periplasmic adaptor subunit [Aquabacterium sp. A08]|uniref:efflux RND transporter periplasmic adaptor subunit n=1 Tax=Aquabacterium sp. A08 TaxID=2718532 RepID=UPI0014206A71|nr:efflux RND transporter periplasmic adaptor subunit [Aquabacterium sp. A08]NIC43606.1 efflux RND transporter periplasmic adaptor subunit [Aquabacterium sp. A08]
MKRFVVGTLVVLVGAVAWAQNTPGGSKPPANAAPISEAKPAIERQEIRAQLLPRRYTTIAAEIGAKVNRLPVSEGGAFRAGQLLVGFDCSLQQAQLQKAQAELEGAQQTHSTNLRLLELNSVGQLEVDLSKAAQSKFNAEVGANKAVLAKCGIAAPFSGRVAEQKVREQQYVQPGQALLDILDDSVLELEFLVPSRWLSWLRTGTKFEVQIDETRKTYPAKFTRIGARVDPVSQSVKVAAAIDGRFPELMAGMSGKVQITPPTDR